MFQELDDIVNHPEDLVQPDRAPAKWLPWLGQFIGAGIPPGGSGNVDADRAAIKDPPRRRRGTVDAILEEVSVGLQPGAVIFYSERDVGGSAYHGQITVRQSDLRPGESLSTIRTRVLRAKPSLVLIDVYVTTGGDYAALRTTHATYAQVTSVFKDYDEVRRNPVKQ